MSDRVASDDPVIVVVEIQNKLGLHIRPSRQFSTVAKSWDAVVSVRNQDRTALADSQLDLLMLLASKGSMLEITASGSQAKEVVDALVQLVNDKFGEPE